MVDYENFDLFANDAEIRWLDLTLKTVKEVESNPLPTNHIGSHELFIDVAYKVSELHLALDRGFGWLVRRSGGSPNTKHILLEHLQCLQKVKKEDYDDLSDFFDKAVEHLYGSKLTAKELGIDHLKSINDYFEKSGIRDMYNKSRFVSGQKSLEEVAKYKAEIPLMVEICNYLRSMIGGYKHDFVHPAGKVLKVLAIQESDESVADIISKKGTDNSWSISSSSGERIGTARLTKHHGLYRAIPSVLPKVVSLKPQVVYHKVGIAVSLKAAKQWIKEETTLVFIARFHDGREVKLRQIHDGREDGLTGQTELVRDIGKVDPTDGLPVSGCRLRLWDEKHGLEVGHRVVLSGPISLGPASPKEIDAEIMSVDKHIVDFYCKDRYGFDGPYSPQTDPKEQE